MKIVYLGGKRTLATDDDIHLWREWTKRELIKLMQWAVVVALGWVVGGGVHVVLAY